MSQLTPARKAEIIEEVCARYPERAAVIRRMLAGIGPREAISDAGEDAPVSPQDARRRPETPEG